jgi:hypothetical protein
MGEALLNLGDPNGAILAANAASVSPATRATATRSAQPTA